MERKRFTENKQIEFPSGLSKNNIVGMKQCWITFVMFQSTANIEFNELLSYFVDTKLKVAEFIQILLNQAIL